MSIAYLYVNIARVGIYICRVVYPVQEEHEGEKSPAPRPEPYGERQQDNLKHSIQDCSSDVNLRNDLVVPKEVRVESLVTEKARVNTEILAAVKAQQLRLFQGSQLMVQIEGMLLMCRFMLLVCAISVVAAERERSTEARIQGAFDARTREEHHRDDKATDWKASG